MTDSLVKLKGNMAQAEKAGKVVAELHAIHNVAVASADPNAFIEALHGYQSSYPESFEKLSNYLLMHLMYQSDNLIATITPRGAQ